MTFMEYQFLYTKAKDFDSFKMFQFDLNFQEWMNNLDADEIMAKLKIIYQTANAETIRDVRKLTNLNMTKFSKIYNIHYRTLQNWELKIASEPPHLKLLVGYTLL